MRRSFSYVRSSKNSGKGVDSMGKILILLPFCLSLAQPLQKREPKELIETIRIWRLTEELNLSEDQAAKLFPKLKKIREVKREFKRKRREILKAIEKELKRKKPREDVLKKEIEDLNREDKEFREKEERLKEEIFEVLTIEQQARFLLFQERFDREIREMIKRIRHRLKR